MYDKIPGLISMAWPLARGLTCDNRPRCCPCLAMFATTGRGDMVVCMRKVLAPGLILFKGPF